MTFERENEPPLRHDLVDKSSNLLGIRKTQILHKIPQSIGKRVISFHFLGWDVQKKVTIRCSKCKCKKKNQGGEKRGSEGQENREAAGLKIREKKAYAIYGL